MTKVNRRKQYEDSVPLKERMVPWLFLSPSLFFVSIIVLIPLLDAFRRSFLWLPVTGLWDFKITRRSLAIVRLSWPQEIP